MVTFYDLPEILQILFMTAQFIALCMGVCLLPMVFQKRKWLPIGLLTDMILLSWGMLAVFSTNIRAQKMSISVPELTQWASKRPIWIFVLLLAVIFGYMLFLLRRECLDRKRTITRFSIKEGLDSLSSGLCFSEPNGRVILVNSRMNDLCHKLTGQDLQNAVAFWQRLQNGQVDKNAAWLSGNDAPAFRLLDGTVWTFAWEKLDRIYQLTAVDITQIHALTTKLEQENKQLEILNKRLRDYGENADALTRARERLDVKAKVHGILGQALLATRRYLQHEDVAPDEAMDLWKHSVAVLHKEAVQEKPQPMQSLKKAAAATGIALKLKGEIPEDPKVSQLFLQAAAESLTNAISHAKAKTLYLEFAEEACVYSVTIYNDGLLPAGPIREGGGLSNLRKNAERIGGQMEIRSVPQFILTVTVGKGNDHDA